MRFRVLGLLAVTVLVAASFTVGGAQNAPPTPPPPLPPGAATPSPGIQIPAPPAGTPPAILTPVPIPTVTLPPTAGPAPRGRRGRSAASPAASGSPTAGPTPKSSPGDTPAPPQFSTLDGVWEVEMQTPAKTFYSHFTIRQGGQTGSDVSGMWDHDNQKSTMAGTFDGRLFTFTVTEAGGKNYTFSGYVENFSDMVGLISDGLKQTAFTAQHRKKEKGINISPAAGGGGRF